MKNPSDELTDSTNCMEAEQWQGNPMTSILDIDLDYFNLFDEPLDRLNELLDWANRPVDKVVDHHHKSFKYWRQALAKRSLAAPQFILHVDKHHDMLGETKPVQFGNFLYFAMRQWPDCRVHWQVTDCGSNSRHA